MVTGRSGIYCRDQEGRIEKTLDLLSGDWDSTANSVESRSAGP